MLLYIMIIIVTGFLYYALLNITSYLAVLMQNRSTIVVQILIIIVLTSDIWKIRFYFRTGLDWENAQKIIWSTVKVRKEV